MDGWFFGKYIERLLEKKGWKRARLAAESGLTKPHINWIVAGKKTGVDRPPDIRQGTVEKLADALGVSAVNLQLALRGIDPDSANARSGKQNTQMEIESMTQKIGNLETQLKLTGAERDRLKEHLIAMINKFCPDEKSKQELYLEVLAKSKLAKEDR